ncbi:MAG: glycoside hydrolase family 2 protein [Promethearchaeota archaeon]
MPEYPRPQLKRDEWLNLNGIWECSITRKSANKPKSFDKKILVPFCIESALSGICQKVKPNQKLWYKRTFEIPEKWADSRILLHFGAVDWETNVWVNEHLVGTHKGGFTPFSFEITKYLNRKDVNEIVVSVWDPTDKEDKIRGKQKLRPFGIFYTPVSGIWQTVWLEPVPQSYISGMKITTNIDDGYLILQVNTVEMKENFNIQVEIQDDKARKIKSMNQENIKRLKIDIPDPVLWSPDNPFLYTIDVLLTCNNTVIDQVKSYFGMRKISLKRNSNGHVQIQLNNEPIFQHGILDQGYWPDGIYTAPTDDALKYDIITAKELGFNMIRKHVKIEPERWYYHCDKIGILVWQDMPSRGRIWKSLSTWILNSFGKKISDKNRVTNNEKNEFFHELVSMIKNLYNHPAIVTWIPFNEGWGQLLFDNKEVIEKIKMLDPTRLVDAASGWFDLNLGDIHDIHHYPGPVMPKKDDTRALCIGEYGGLGMTIKKHVWKTFWKWAYKKFKNVDELAKSYHDLIQKLAPIKEKGLSAAVYTQLTDVEGEVNGLMTYDRAVIKIDLGLLKDINKQIFS